MTTPHPRHVDAPNLRGVTPIDGDMSINDNILAQAYIAIVQAMAANFDTDVQHNIETIDAFNQTVEYLLENRVVTGPKDAGGDSG